MKLSIGCGWKYDGSKFKYKYWDKKRIESEKKVIEKHKGYVGLDRVDYGQHYVRDLRRGLPFANNSIDGILADNVLEHIPLGEHFGGLPP